MKKKVILYICLLALACIVFFCGSGFTVEADATLKHNGKGSAVLTIESDTPQEAFEQELADRLYGYSQTSGDSDMLALKSLRAVEDGYEAEISFRRIDKIKVRGEFELKSLSEYLSLYNEDAEDYVLQKLVKWSTGNLAGTVNGFHDGDYSTINVSRADRDLKIQPRTAAGEDVALADFISQGKSAKNNATIFTFYCFDLGAVTHARMTFPGKISYVAGENIRLIDESTVEVTPSTQDISVMRSDGSLTDVADAGAFVGYVVFDKSMSPLAVGLIVFSCLVFLLLVGIVLLVLYRRGKKGAQSRAFPSSEGNGSAEADTMKEKCSTTGNRDASATLSVPAGAASSVQSDGAAVQVAEGVPVGTVACVKGMSRIAEGWRGFLKSQTWRGIKKHKMLYLFLVPAIVLVAVFCYGPMFGLIMAFQDFNLQEGVFGSEFIGLKTFYNILFNPEIANYRAYRNTLYISLIRIATNFPIVLLFALVLNEIKNRKLRAFVVAVSYVPYFISWISVGGMAYNLFNYNYGVFNQVLVSMGAQPVNWYAEPKYWWGILAVSSLWKSMGWSTLIYMSCLGTIDGELYDACMIDGGGKIRQAFTVTLPGLANVIIMQLILDVSSIMRDNYDQIMAMINGTEALNDTVYVVGMVEYNAIKNGHGYSTATAFGLIRGLIGLVLVLVSNAIAKKSDNEGIL